MTDDRPKKLADAWIDICIALPAFGLKAGAMSLLASVEHGAEPAIARAGAAVLERLADVTPPPGDLFPTEVPTEGWGVKMAIGAPAAPQPLDIPGNIPGSPDTVLTEQRLAVIAENEPPGLLM